MKKLLLLAMSAIIIAFTACNQNEPTISTNVDGKVNQELSTTVTVYDYNYNSHYVTGERYYYNGNNNNSKIITDKIENYDKNDNLVGAGEYVGDYLVP